MLIYRRDLSVCRFWYPTGVLEPIPEGTKESLNPRALKKLRVSWVLMAHACNLSYSVGSQFEVSLGK
jgi:hypothetical protein